MNGSYDYGLWLLVAIHVGLFTFFGVSFLLPRRTREWRNFGAFTAFVVALFAEMYGFPFTIYLLGVYLGRLPFADPFSHLSGNLWASLFFEGRGAGILMLLGGLVMLGGALLVSRGWKLIYRAEGRLVTEGIYGRIRHPQYLGMFVLILGTLIQWPTLITLIMAPVLAFAYYRLSCREEQDLEAQFGQLFREYKAQVPAFIPRFGKGGAATDARTSGPPLAKGREVEDHV